MRWRLVLTYMLIISCSFGLVAYMLINIMGDYLLSQRVREQQMISEQLAIKAASGLVDKDAAGLYSICVNASRQYGGRVLVLDAYGTVQVDSFAELNGSRLLNPEVLRVLSGAESNAYNFYPQQKMRFGWLMRLLGLDDSTSTYGIYASSIVADDRIAGVLLYSCYEVELSSRMRYISVTVVYWLMGVGALTLLLSILASRMFTRPIRVLREGIDHLSQGDFEHSIKAKIKGNSEFAKLAAAFDMMSGKLADLDKRRSQFVSNASHELKTPLTSMKLYLEAILYSETFDPDVTREFLQEADGEIDRLTELIDDLLTIVKMDSGKSMLRLTDIQLDELLASAKKRLEPIAESRNISLTLDAHIAPVIEGDAGRLTQVFNNLIDNAIKYTPEGDSVRITLDEEDGKNVIRVSDTGIGIPKEDQEHLFERFYRVDPARSRETGGTGLGLSIVQQILQLHNGYVTVDSTPDKGSTFTVTLPK